MPSWSELAGPERRVELEIELAKIGTRPEDVVADALDIAELRPLIEDLSPEARLRVALEWFGDQGNPQPPRSERTNWHVTGYTTDWPGGRLPLLEDATAAVRPAKRRGPPPAAELTGWPRDPFEKVVELRVTRGWGKHTIANHDGVKGRIADRQVGNIIRLIEAGRLLWDKENRRIRTGPGFELKPGPGTGTVVLVSH